MFHFDYGWEFLTYYHALPTVEQRAMVREPPEYVMVPCTLPDPVGMALRQKGDHTQHILGVDNEPLLLPTVMDTLDWPTASQFWERIIDYSPGMLAFPAVFGQPSHPLNRTNGLHIEDVEPPQAGISCLWAWSAWPITNEQARRCEEQVDEWFPLSPYRELDEWGYLVGYWGSRERLFSYEAFQVPDDVSEEHREKLVEKQELALADIDRLFEIERELVIDPATDYPLLQPQEFSPVLDGDLADMWESLLASRHSGRRAVHRALSKPERVAIRSDYFQWPSF